MTTFPMNNVEEKLFVNMGETAIYFDTHSNCTVSEKGMRTVSIRRGCSVSKKCTVCIAVAADGTKLPLFVIFKAADNGPVANRLHSIMLSGIYGCTQEKGWIDNRIMQEWKEKIWMPYVQGKSNSVLLLDQMQSHIHPDFIDSVADTNTQIIEILFGFTYVFQPCDVVVIMPFKTTLIEACQIWKTDEYTRMGGSGKIPVPGRKQVLEWLKKYRESFQLK